jgi:tetratricopeptide (TPR) repeat protein
VVGTALVLGLAVVMVVVGGLGLFRPGLRPSPEQPSASAAAGAGGVPVAGGGALASRIPALQSRLHDVPGDAVAWATLGLAYVEQARVAVDPTLYPKAEGALRQSLAIDTADNFAAYTSLAALAAARHDFAAARDFSRQGLAINPASATLHGTLGDAETQLGNYPAAFEAIQRMVDLAPTTASLARASYAWELRGDVGRATALMQRASDAAFTPADRAFTRYYLGELAFNAGDPASALAHDEDGLRDDPSFARLLEGKAKSLAALGRTDEAVATWSVVVDRLPEPAYLIQFGELLESLGRPADADRQFGLFTSTARLFEANGVSLDADAALFQADHGEPAEALRQAEAGIRTRQFLEMDDAYAWALHVNGRDAEALAWSDKALALGTRNSLFHFHAGMIRRSLGDVDAARGHLSEALEINPHFNPLFGPAARQALDSMRGAA